jgi:hypothetical protein
VWYVLSVRVCFRSFATDTVFVPQVVETATHAASCLLCAIQASLLLTVSPSLCPSQVLLSIVNSIAADGGTSTAPQQSQLSPLLARACGTLLPLRVTTADSEEDGSEGGHDTTAVLAVLRAAAAGQVALQHTVTALLAEPLRKSLHKRVAKALKRLVR